MAVNIINLSPVPSRGGNVPGGSASVARSFSDNFTRANNANIGKQWVNIPLFSGSTGVNCFASINTNRLNLTAGAATGANFFFPGPLVWMSQNQFQSPMFCQFAITSFGIPLTSCLSGLVFAGLETQAAATGIGYYSVIINPGAVAGSQFQISKNIYSGNTGAGPTVTNLGAAFGTYTLADVIRFTATNTGGTWSLNVLQNGTSIATQTDASLSFLMPGIEGSLTGATAAVNISQFSAGMGV